MTASTHSLTVAQAAEALDVSERTVWRYLKSGRLQGETVGAPGSQRTLIDPDAVTALRDGRTGATDASALRDECARLRDELAAVRSERDDLERRVGLLQRALARPAQPGVAARAVERAALALTRVRALRAST